MNIISYTYTIGDQNVCIKCYCEFWPDDLKLIRGHILVVHNLYAVCKTYETCLV